MKVALVLEAKREAERFLARIRELELHGTRYAPVGSGEGNFDYGKLTGAVRRASLDLTRGLADLRRR